jgi:hypothetical protein
MKTINYTFSLLFMLFTFSICNAQTKTNKTVKPKIDNKYIGKWSNDNTELFYISFGHVEITSNSITYYSGEFAEYLNFKIEKDKILLFYNGIEGVQRWNSNKKEDAKPKCKTQIGYLTKEGNSIVLNIQNDVCGQLPKGKHVLMPHNAG